MVGIVAALYTLSGGRQHVRRVGLVLNAVEKSSTQSAPVMLSPSVVALF